MSVVSSSVNVQQHSSKRTATVRLPDRSRRVRVRTISRVFSVLPPILLGLFLLLAWYIATANGRINSIILPTPEAVFASLIQGISTGIFVQNALITIQESLLGFLLAVALALPLGYGIAKSRLLAHTLQPYLAAGQAVPAIVIAPFLFLWLGIGTSSVVFVCMLVVLFPLVINTIFGIQSIDRELLEAARLEGAAGPALLTHIEFPLALPAILAAVRTGMTLSVTGAIVGEFFCNPDQGLGALVNIALHEYNMAFMFAAVIVLAVLAACYYALAWLLMLLARIVY